MRHVSDAERRARLATRHALSPAARLGTPEAAVQAVAALHATEPASVYLSCWVRVKGLCVADLDRALYSDRSVVKQLAMRRTLFVFPRDLLAAAWSSASARVARTERARVARDVARAGLADDGERWLDRARGEVVALLGGVAGGLTAAEVRRAVPMIDARIDGQPLLAGRVLTHLGATADIVRGANTGRWITSRPRWTMMSDWVTPVPVEVPAAVGYRELVRRWLNAFGPGTEDDIAWWLGDTLTVVRQALSDLDAVPVSLDGGGTGWLLPNDLGEPPDPGPWAALLPVLDPTVMGWQARDFYLGPHRAQLFDRNGNAGTTAWVDGRVVGCWVQDEAGKVDVRLLEAVTARARWALDEEAERLTEWLGGIRIGTVYPSPAMRHAGR